MRAEKKEEVMKRTKLIRQPEVMSKYEPVPRSANSLHGEATIIYCKKKGARSESRALPAAQ